MKINVKEVWYIKLNNPTSNWNWGTIEKMSKCILWPVNEIPQGMIKSNLISKNGKILGQMAFLGWIEKDNS